MKYIKKFKVFEEIDLGVNITDPPELKMSKEKFETFDKYLKDYNAKKALIDKAYLTSKTDADLQKSIELIIGKTDITNKEDRNPFLVEYLNVASLKRKIDNLQKGIVTDKITKDDFKQQLGLSSQQTTKDSINIKLKDIENRISTKTANIASLSKDVNNAQKILLDKMSKIEKEMKEYIKNISSSSIK